MGDFNLSPTYYNKHLEQGLRSDPHYELIAFLYNHNYIDQHPKDDLHKEYAKYYSSNVPTSRIDLVWYPDSMIRDDLCFDQVWQLPSSCQLDTSLYTLDHRCMIVYFTKHLFLNELPVHRTKQKSEWR